MIIIIVINVFTTTTITRYNCDDGDGRYSADHDNGANDGSNDDNNHNDSEN